MKWQIAMVKISEHLYQMDRINGTAFNNQQFAGFITIPRNDSIVCISDEPAIRDVSFSQGTWKAAFVTDTNWKASCKVLIGEWNGTIFTPVGTQTFSIDLSEITSDTAHYYTFDTGITCPQLTVHAGNYLAMEIFNSNPLAMNFTKSDLYSGGIVNPGESGDGNILTGEGLDASYLNAPGSNPGQPLPELASGVLLAIGLAGIAVIYFLARHKSRNYLLINR
jgi:hypothetical protein